MSDASRIQLLMRPETVWGEATAAVPSPGNATTRVRLAGTTLTPKNTTVLSAEIRSDRQRTDMPLVGIDAEGDVNLEMLYGEPHDSFLEATLCGAWTAPAAITDAITTTAGGLPTSALVNAPLGNFTQADLHKAIVAGVGTVTPVAIAIGATVKYIGEVLGPTQIRLSAFANGLSPVGADAAGTGLTLAIGRAVPDLATSGGSPIVNSALANFSQTDVGSRVIGGSIPAGAIISSVQSATQATLNGNAGGTGTILALIADRGENLRNGVQNRSFGLEVGYLDLGTPSYIYYDGMIPSKYALDVTARQIIKHQMNFQGRKSLPTIASIAGNITPTEPTATAPMKAGSSISILSAGSGNTEMLGVACSRLTLEIVNNLRTRPLVNSEFSAEPGRNVMDITGQIETYFDSIARLQQFLANGKFGVKFRMSSSDLVSTAGLTLDNTYEFTLPTLKISDAPVPVPGNETDVMQVFSYRALLDPAVGYAINAQRGIII